MDMVSGYLSLVRVIVVRNLWLSRSWEHVCGNTLVESLHDFGRPVPLMQVRVPREKSLVESLQDFGRPGSCTSFSGHG